MFFSNEEHGDRVIVYRQRVRFPLIMQAECMIMGYSIRKCAKIVGIKDL